MVSNTERVAGAVVVITMTVVSIAGVFVLCTAFVMWALNMIGGL